jgi:hypothetical protein
MPRMADARSFILTGHDAECRLRVVEGPIEYA